MSVSGIQGSGEISEKFGSIREWDPEGYDATSRMVFAENINWDYDVFPDYGALNNMGFNTTADRGQISRLNAGETTEIFANFIVDAYNHLFGGIAEFSCDLTGIRT